MSYDWTKTTCTMWLSMLCTRRGKPRQRKKQKPWPLRQGVADSLSSLLTLQWSKCDGSPLPKIAAACFTGTWTTTQLPVRTPSCFLCFTASSLRCVTTLLLRLQEVLSSLQELQARCRTSCGAFQDSLRSRECRGPVRLTQTLASSKERCWFLQAQDCIGKCPAVC